MVSIGDAAGQQLWEALALLVSLRLWGKYFKGGQAQLKLRGDSVVALTLATKLASSSRLLNAIGAEIALELEVLDISEVFGSHSPGKLLVIADHLSRIHMPGHSGDLPAELASAKRREAPMRDGSFYRVWTASAD